MADKQVDDLTRIKGIGPSRQKWFNEVLGITSFKQLAALSPDIIESSLKEEGGIVSRNTVEEWITEAAELASEDQPALGQEQGAPEPAIQNNGWHPFASFVVEFQERQEGNERELRTTVHHMETAEEQTLIHEIEENTEGKTWPGLENRQLCEWMAKRLNAKLKENREAKQASKRKSTDRTAPLSIAVNQIRILQPPEGGAPVDLVAGGEPRPFIKGNEPFTVEATFRVTDEVSRSLLPAKYEARFYMENLDTGKEWQLDDICRDTIFRSGEATCSVELDEPSISPGFYRVIAVITLSGRPGSMGYLESSSLQVM